MRSNCTEFGRSNTCNLTNNVGLNFHKYAITWYLHLFLIKFLINTTLFTALGMNKVKVVLDRNLLQEFGHFLLFAQSHFRLTPVLQNSQQFSRADDPRRCLYLVIN